jgi:hypothetical protein
MLADDVRPADDDQSEPAVEAIPAADFLYDEPTSGTVVSDEPPAYKPPVYVPPVREPPVAEAAQFVEQVVPLSGDENAPPVFADDPEEVATPRSLPATPFKPGSDESDLDRFNRQVTDVPIDIRPTEGDLPPDLSAARMAGEPTIDETWPSGEPGDVFCTYTPWTICYRPLYFEDIKLERYGCNVGCLQTGLSGVRFFSSIAALPYKMTVRRPRSCECSNGFSRCGDCPLPGYGRREFRIDASLIEAAAVAGVVYILP